ncbi:MAG: bifunctional phosphoribosylaminoimidazolecarboxamide formyltransferase/IMP cyclohydrolase [Spirochaetia bacterium]|nr:bifunctional phosphoribosylaminoimidazolecarboxamide formyltransferase/IMP cyclohydrolase [Spirochaetia bacterium]
MPTAILSVYDKTGLIEFAAGLSRLGWSFLASGGTAAALKSAGLETEEIADYTGAREILGGRVKTLHPAIHGGILARSSGADLAEIAALGYRAVDMVVVDLYPFEKTIADPSSTRQDIIEKIDIGGVALLRAAAKNHERVAVISSTEQYSRVLSELEGSKNLSAATLRDLAGQAFARTASYDAAIAAWFSADGIAGAALENVKAAGDDASENPVAASTHPAILSFSGWKVQDLRYGENPHQNAALYSAVPGGSPMAGRLLQGKELSYNNILDLDAAWHAVSRFKNPAAVVVKHLTPCGIAEVREGSGDTLAQALAKAIACDPISAFGGIIAVNRPFDEECVRTLGELFAECITAPGFSPEAAALLAKKKNLRVLIPGKDRPRFEIRSVLGGFLRQDIDQGDPSVAAWKVVSARAPSAEELRDLEFAWKACMSVKSNAIVFAKESATVGIGAGQPNRVDSVRIAARHAGEKARGAVMASDAFFPFPDSVEEAAAAGIRAIVQPGGSIRDKESLAAADKAGMAMVLTGVRHFRH